MFSLKLFSTSNNILYALIDDELNIKESNQTFDNVFDKNEQRDNIKALFEDKKIEFSMTAEKYEFIENGMTVRLNQENLKDKVILLGELFYSDENIVYKEISKQNNEIQNLNRELHKKNREIKNVLEELNKTRMKLIQEGRLMGLLRIAGGVAHEINNPLSFVTGNIRYIDESFRKMTEKGMISYFEDEMDGMTQDEYREVTEEVFEGLERIKEIVESFRAYTNVDRYQKSCECDLRECIKLVVKNLPSSLSKDISIELELQKEVNSFIDLSLFNDAINHLLMNALESFESYDHAIVKVSLKHINGKIQILIEDNGSGLKEENKAYIFDPFFTTKEIGKGEGIGLSLCYDYFVNTLKGSIDVVSEDNRGTRIVIEFLEQEE